MTTSYQINSLMFPEEYISKGYVRGEIQEEKVQEYIEVAKHNKGWPFPAIIVMPLSEEEKTDQELNPARKTGVIVDGVTRTQAAIGCSMKTIIAEVVQHMPPAEFCLAQLQYNLTHGQDLSMKLRNRWIMRLRDTFKLKLAEIAKQCNLSMAMVSRIANYGPGSKGKSGSETRGRKARKKGKKGKGKKGNQQTQPQETTIPPASGIQVDGGIPVFSVQRWYEGLTNLNREYWSHRESIHKAEPFAPLIADQILNMANQLSLHTVEHAKTQKGGSNAKTQEEKPTAQGPDQPASGTMAKG